MSASATATAIGKRRESTVRLPTGPPSRWRLAKKNVA